jgi:hypothetical protein
MKAALTLSAAAVSAALLCALPTSVEALNKVETRNLDIAEDDESRGLMHLVSHYDFVLGHSYFLSIAVGRLREKIIIDGSGL